MSEHQVICPVCAKRVESMTMGRETGLLIWHVGPHVLGDTPCAFPTPPSRRDLPPRPAGEHGRTGEPCRFCGEPDNDRSWCCEERMVADQGPPGPRPGPAPAARPAPAGGHDPRCMLLAGPMEPTCDCRIWKMFDEPDTAPTELDEADQLVCDLDVYFERASRAVSNGGPTPPWDGRSFQSLRRRVRAVAAVLAAPSGPTEEER